MRSWRRGLVNRSDAIPTILCVAAMVAPRIMTAGPFVDVLSDIPTPTLSVLDD